MSPAPLSAPARGGHYPSRWYIVQDSSFGFVTAKSSAELDGAALSALQLLLDIVVANIHFVWILPLLEVDPVRKDGVGVEVKVDGLVVNCLEETGKSRTVDDSMVADGSLSIPGLGGTGCAASVVLS